MADYTKMWEGLKLDLTSHDAVLELVGSTYQDLFLSQENRPKGMEYFDFVVSEIHGLRVKELMDAKESGRKVVGAYCVFVPEEIVLALDAIFVGLCAGGELGFDLAEEYIPRNTCALIKSSFGFKLAKVCPYIEATDMVVGENTCDGKKKAYETLKTIQENLYVMDIPQMKSEAGRALLKAEFAKFTAALEELTGNKMTVEALKKGITTVNNKRAALLRLAELRAATPVPISGMDVLLANQVFFYDDPVRFTAAVNTICDELELRIKEDVGVFPKDTPRILLSGCPMTVPNWKMPHVIETSGATIVGEEMCTGERGVQNLTSMEGDTFDVLLDNIVDRYMKIDCAVFTPNESRYEHVKEMAKKYKADGVIHYGLQFCQPYAHEAMSMGKALEEAGIPVLSVETDYSMEDMGQLKTRVEAFVERIQG
ncbi:MAG: double-cubane-cluster-containing anaerobic reductase [Bacteroidales bacterium]|jgi:benzoyl-CoA reductase/2-hydroxyglutaryl-CoA dehydratase subunit BcrC/BadD/HgdB|nr:double-cubane-cluster-containing anaerobic reductase [Bacteroidales bacterium]